MSLIAEKFREIFRASFFVQKFRTIKFNRLCQKKEKKIDRSNIPMIFSKQVRSNIDTRNAIPYTPTVNTEYSPLNSIISARKDIRCCGTSSEILENWQRTRIYFACAGKSVSGPRGRTRFRLFTCVTTPNSGRERTGSETNGRAQLQCAMVVVLSLFTRIAPA